MGAKLLAIVLLRRDDLEPFVGGEVEQRGSALVKLRGRSGKISKCVETPESFP